MPTWELDFIVDGDAATEASVNNRFTDGVSAINALTEASTRLAAFNGRHATSFAPGAAATQGDHGLHTYAIATFGADMVYDTYGNDAGTEAAPVVGGAVDRIIIGHTSQTGAYTGGLAKLTFNRKVGIANGSLSSSILVLFNVEVRRFTYGQVAQADGMTLMVCIQYQLNDGGGPAWYTIDESERFVSLEDHVIAAIDPLDDIDFDVPIRTLITKEVVTENGNPATHNVTGVRAMMGVISQGGVYTGFDISLNRWNLTVIPVFTSDPV